MDLSSLRSAGAAPGLDVPSVARLGRHRLELPLGAAVAVVVVAAAVLAPSPVRWAGALSVVAMACTIAIEGDRLLIWHRMPVMVAAATLTLAEGGIVDIADERSVWRPLVALVAYPVLGRALMRQVTRYRLVRPTDVVVEAVLIGAAFSIALQVALEWWGAPGPVTGSVENALPALLVGLDVALVVVVARAMSIRAVRNGGLGIAGAGTFLLFAGHLAAVSDLAVDSPVGMGATVAVVGALVLFAASAVYTSVVHPPAVAASEPPLFSGGHAGVVVVSVLAAPVILAVHVVREISVSASVAAGAAISGMVLASHIVTLLRERAHSEFQASHDALTGLPNRLLFTDRLERAIAHAERNGTPVGVLYVDLDRFKDVNDTLGHDAGDQLLRTTAERLLECARHEDTVARLAGDEFAILLPHLAAADDVLVVADRMLETLKVPVELGKHSVHSAGSVGVAVFPGDGTDPQDLLNAADAAMYRAKDRGGATVGLFSAELHHHAATRLALETDLIRAIAGDELVLHYQPIIDGTDGRIRGAEALVRWNHPERGLLGPGEFVPVAEQSDIIIRLGEWVIREACHELARWEAFGLGDRFVSVNVSGRHFRADLVSTVTSALRQTGVDPSRLVMELTESAAVDDIEVVADRLHELRQIGVRAAIDDFGTGYCGLQYLGDLPVSTLKLDRSFVQAMTPKAAAIVGATIAMARSLGMTMVAEGVETVEQRRFLERQGCDRLQGYHLGRPMPADDLVDRMRAEDGAGEADEPAEVAAPEASEAREPSEPVRMFRVVDSSVG